MQPLVIYGTGGHARETAELIHDINTERLSWDLLGYLTDERSAWGSELNGLPVLGDRSWLERGRADVHVVIGIGTPQSRLAVAECVRPLGVSFPVLRHPTAVASRYIELGPGTNIAAGCIVTVNVSIGAFVILNRACNVSHDCRLGDFVTVAPGVQVSGNVSIGHGCDIGVGSSIIQGTSVGEWTIVGAGAVVTRPLPPNCTAVGVPARIIKERPPGWHLG